MPNFDPGYMFTRAFHVKRKDPEINEAYDSRPDTSLGGTPGYFDHDRGDGVKNLARRKQESNFFITINSNQAPTAADDVDASLTAMNKMLKEISKESVMATYIKFGPKHEEYMFRGRGKYGTYRHS